MKSNNAIARKIYEALKAAGVDEMGNMSVFVIEKALDEHIKPTPKGKERIEITTPALVALRSFLMNDRMGTGEGYSDFILKAIEIRRKLEQ